jgi:secondary thiamine-phosphate synthase enzyme
MIKMIEVKTSKREELVDIGPQVRGALRDSGMTEGVVHLWSMHTTCALTVNENADPDVKRDLVWKARDLIPEDQPEYRHGEGNSDAHMKTSLFGPGLTLLVQDGALVLGTWQGVLLAEWDGPRSRRIAVKFSS